jgi:hypothetical protein
MDLTIISKTHMMKVVAFGNESAGAGARARR